MVVRGVVRVVVWVVVVSCVDVEGGVDEGAGGDEGGGVPRAAHAELRVAWYSGTAEAGEGPQTLGPSAKVAPEAAPMARW